MYREGLELILEKHRSSAPDAANLHKIHHLNTKFIMLIAKFIILNANFIMFNT